MKLHWPTKQIMFGTLNILILYLLSAAITTVSLHKDYVSFTPLTSDASPRNYKTMFNDRTGNSFNSTFVNTQETLSGTNNLTQQDIQTPSHFINKEIVETTPTTKQPIHLLFILQLQHHIKNSIPTDNHSISSKNTICCSEIFSKG